MNPDQNTIEAKETDAIIARKAKIRTLMHKQENIKEQIKDAYEQLDHVLYEAGKIMVPGEEVEFPILMKTVTLVDNFENTNTVFRPAAVRRFELKIGDL
jgi:transcription termination factor Rho